MLCQESVDCLFRFIGFAATCRINQTLEIWNVERIDDLSAPCAHVGHGFGYRCLCFLIIRCLRVSAIVGGHPDDADPHTLKAVWYEEACVSVWDFPIAPRC
jgi:hypothetical protein